MNINDYSFHDAEIIEVKELIGYQIVEYLINFPVDWERSEFEHRILKFTEVTHYIINEIPFTGPITILELRELEINKTALGKGNDELIYERNKIEIVTNAGNRIIHYLECHLLKP